MPSNCVKCGVPLTDGNTKGAGRLVRVCDTRWEARQENSPKGYVATLRQMGIIKDMG